MGYLQLHNVYIIKYSLVKHLQFRPDTIAFMLRSINQYRLFFKREYFICNICLWVLQTGPNTVNGGGL